MIPKTVKKVATTLYYYSKASSLDCIPVVVQKNCESECSYMSVDLFNMSLNKSFLLLKSPICGPVFKNF